MPRSKVGSTGIVATTHTDIYRERMVIKVKPPALTGGWLLNKHDFEKLIIVLAWA